MKLLKLLRDNFGSYFTLILVTIFILACFILDFIYKTKTAKLESAERQKMLNLIAEKVSYKILERLIPE